MCSFLISISAIGPLNTNVPRRAQRRTILSERACLIAEQILYPSELLRQCARSDNRVGYLIVSHDLLRVDGLAHIQVDAQTEEGFIRGTSSYERVRT